MKAVLKRKERGRVVTVLSALSLALLLGIVVTLHFARFMGARTAPTIEATSGFPASP